MKDSELQFNRSCHVLYSKACKRQIREHIDMHYPQSAREAVWNQVQQLYVDYLSDWRTDLGGKRNFHNGVGGTYDCIALMAYYVVCKDVTSLAEIEAMETALFLPAFRILSRFVDCNRPLFKRLMYKSCQNAALQCAAWHDYEMSVAPYDKDGPIYYEFTACPIAEFAAKHDLSEVMPAFCNPDYAAMELIHARLVRRTTCSCGDKCDYTIYSDRDPRLAAHPEYQDAAGYRRN